MICCKGCSPCCCCAGHKSVCQHCHHYRYSSPTSKYSHAAKAEANLPTKYPISTWHWLHLHLAPDFFSAMLRMSFYAHSALSTKSKVQVGAACLCCVAILLKVHLLFLYFPSQEVGIGVIHACLAFSLQHLLRVYDAHIIYDSNLVLRIAQ